MYIDIYKLFLTSFVIMALFIKAIDMDIHIRYTPVETPMNSIMWILKKSYLTGLYNRHCSCCYKLVELFNLTMLLFNRCALFSMSRFWPKLLVQWLGSIRTPECPEDSQYFLAVSLIISWKPPNFFAEHVTGNCTLNIFLLLMMHNISELSLLLRLEKSLLQVELTVIKEIPR
jgi:hypothetical protein